MTGVASWLVDVAIPELIPGHLTALPRERARDADDRLERTARGWSSRKVNRGPTSTGRRTR